MFEGHIKGIDYPETGDSPVLRQLRWTDLMARLAATRDLRAALGHGESDPLAASATSFAGFRSGLSGPGANLDAANSQQGEQPVNQDVLSRGKVTRLERLRTANDLAGGDRENT